MRAVDVLAFSHIGFVVESVDRFRASWGALLGLDDWLVRDVGQPAGRVQLHGEPVDQPTRSRVAFTKFRGTSLELIEPVEGESGAAEWLRTSGAGMQHIGVWVRDLPTELERLGDQVEITYSAAALHPALAARPVAATVPAGEAPARPPFWAYVEPLTSDTRWSLELLDAKFAADYRAYYGGNAYYPGELPGTSAV
jgi:catechol 2,3-dioxygenase-like lactoylglutathione lyase family enzyme